MTQIHLKRVYEKPSPEDGFRVLVDRLWPRGEKKENLPYDKWEKEITPSPELRKWFHEDIEGRWSEFSKLYEKELEGSEAAKSFAWEIKKYPVVTLLYATKDEVHNHASILKSFLEKESKELKIKN